MTRTIRLSGSLIFLGSMCLPSAASVGPEAVWRPSAGKIRNIMQKCGNVRPLNLNPCFLAEMRASGASPEAMTFSRQLNEGTKGLVGFLHDFREAGRVDVAYVEYVFRANENLACYLVNGTPPLIDVDDTKILETNSLERNSRYATIKARYPKISIWPGDWNTTMYPIARALSTGGERFIVSYWLQNGCHACERIGSVQFAFDFDKDGKFLGTQFQSVEAVDTAGRQSNANGLLLFRYELKESIPSRPVAGC
ncbi:MAG: hypothetical protein ACR2IV_00995 [Bryobacteraceae bacterium]